jgi:DNA polymerase-3 subunit gamma/tau
MAYIPLHHKYRPQRFADVVGQSAVVQTLNNAIRTNRIAPAYLFCGPRGTGKTSSARILAKSLNCIDGPTPEPCNQCEACRSITNGSSLDTIEIDAASNTGVDNIRELIERSQFAPVSSRFKVYVLDEVHMLSTAAFNALLKTLEEPPPQVVFVLATTDPQRVLPTVISRCQRFDFRRIPLLAMVDHLAAIARQESIAIAAPALELIAQIAQGGLRDAESLLDQLSLLQSEISVEDVWDLVGAVPERELLALLDAIARKDPQQVVTQVRHLMDNGKEPLLLLQNLTSFYRDLLLAKTAPSQREMVALTQPTWETLIERSPHYTQEAILATQHRLLEVEPLLKHTTQPRLWLEISLLDLLQSSAPATSTPPVPAVPIPTIPSTSAPPPTPARTPTAAPTESRTSQAVSHPVPPPPPRSAAPESTPVESEPPPATVEPSAPPPAPPPTAAAPTFAAQWHAILSQLPPSRRGLLTQCVHIHAETPDRVQLGLSPKMLAFEPKIRSQIAALQSSAQSLLGREVKLELVMVEAIAATPTLADSSLVDATVAPPATETATSSNESRFAPDPIPSPPPKPPLTENGATEPSAAAPAPAPAPFNPYADDGDEVERAARRLAEFFSGTVVDLESGSLDGDGLEGSIPPVENGTLASIPPEPQVEVLEDEEEEIPF